ncbi:MAG: Ig-like domain-containing protein, partial [Elusimicrobiota bacterium]
MKKIKYIFVILFLLCFADSGLDAAGIAIEGIFDNEDPVVNIISPDNSSNLNSDTVIVEFTIDAGESGLDDVNVRVDNQSWVVADSSYSHTFSGLEEGTRSLEIQAKDNAGNTGAAGIEVTIDKKVPAINIISPQDGSVFNT